MMGSSSAAMALAGGKQGAAREAGGSAGQLGKSLFAGTNGSGGNFGKALADAENPEPVRALLCGDQEAAQEPAVRRALGDLLAAMKEKGLLSGKLKSDQKLAALLEQLEEEAKASPDASAMAALLELLAAGAAASAGEQVPDGGAVQPEKAGQGERLAALLAGLGRSTGTGEQAANQAANPGGPHKAGENKQGLLQAEGADAFSADLQRLLESLKTGGGQTEGGRTASQGFFQLARIVAQAADSSFGDTFVQEGKAGGDGVEARLQGILQAGAAAGESFREADSAAGKSGMAAFRDLEAQIRELLGKSQADAKPGRGETAGPTSSSGADAAVFPAANTGERANAGQEESGAEQGLRQLLQQLAGREKPGGAEQGNGAKADPAFADILGGKADSADAQQLLRQLNVEKSASEPGALKQNSQQTADIFGQAQSGSQGGEKAQATAAGGAQQTGGSFDRALQGAENRIVSQVFVRLFSGVRQGAGSMSINMHPPELGTVKVRIHSESGHLQVSLHPQNHQVAGVLEKHLPALQQSLVDQGVEVSDLQVSVDSGGEEGEAQFGEQAFSEAGRGRGRPGGTEEQEPDEQTRNPETEQSAGHSGLSLRV